MEKAYYEMVEGPHRGYCASLKKKKQNNLVHRRLQGGKNANPGSHSQQLETLPLQVNPRAQKINIQEH